MRLLALTTIMLVGLANLLFGSQVFTDATQTSVVLWARSASFGLGVVTVTALYVYLWLVRLANSHRRAAYRAADYDDDAQYRRW